MPPTMGPHSLPSRVASDPQGGVSVRPSAPGEAALRLSWLPPRTDSLLALASHPNLSVWPRLRTDPGAVLLVARHLPDEPTLVETTFTGAAIVRTAHTLRTQNPQMSVDWAHPDVEPIYQAIVRHAVFAERWARRLGGCDPEAAWIGAMVAGLGWLAVACVDPAAVAECWREPVYGHDLANTQRRLWGMDAASIGRRLARRWHLPAWLAPFAGGLHCSADMASRLGADERLFRIVQWAAVLTADSGDDLGYGIAFSREELATGLALSPDDPSDDPRDDWLTFGDASSPSLPDPNDAVACALALAAWSRQCSSGVDAERLEADLDRLHEELARQRRTEKERLEARKLRALAEFAAGAGHEINNPLAVISVHAQQLLQHEEDETRRASLRGILRQTERIHQILRELMQFARPSRPRKQEADLCQLVRESVESLRPWADERKVRLEVGQTVESAPVFVDANQIRTVLTCLIRNAVEAAPSEGWARVWLERGPEVWEVIVEDSGAGPPSRRHDLLFNPFFSGRAAGRGRGLGLPTAWRLAQENEGDVRFEPSPASPARFVLSLPIRPSITTPLPTSGNSLRRTA